MTVFRKHNRQVAYLEFEYPDRKTAPSDSIPRRCKIQINTTVKYVDCISCSKITKLQFYWEKFTAGLSCLRCVGPRWALRTATIASAGIRVDADVLVAGTQ